MVYDGATTCRIRAIQDRYRAASRPLTMEGWESQPRWKHLVANVAKLFSPLL